MQEKPGTKDVSRVIYAPNAWILPCCVNEKAKFIAKLVTEKISGRQDLDLVWVQWLANNKKKPKRYEKPQFCLGKKIYKKEKNSCLFLLGQL